MAWAYQGREFAEWDRLACLIASIQNCHIDTKKQRPLKPYDVWHRPGARRPTASRLTADALHALKGMFTKRME